MKTHFRGYYGAACGAYNTTLKTNDPNEVTCKTCRKTKEWKAASKITPKKAIINKDIIQLSYKIRSEQKVDEFIDIDSLNDVLESDLRIMEILPDNRVILMDEEDPEMMYLVTIKVNRLELDN